MSTYPTKWFRSFQECSQRSAQEIVPLVVDLIQPRSVIDVGCGVGAWLSVFKGCGVGEIRGIDGDYIDRKALLIPQKQFRSVDLTKPFQLDEQFDLVVSLEVAEHLPRESAEAFISSLVRLGPVILFSAAVPFQGGNHHVNEQWPEYWADLFQKKGYRVIDCIRQKIWHNNNVQFYYAQNILLFASEDYLEGHPRLKQEAEHTNTAQLSLVHPDLYLSNLSLLHRAGAGKLLSTLPAQVRDPLSNSISWLTHPDTMKWVTVIIVAGMIVVLLIIIATGVDIDMPF
jgi:SAM-dependent methyltransferase